jgi:hypothetical protein
VNREEAIAAAQGLATKLVDDHLEAKPCIGLLDYDGQLNLLELTDEHPIPILEAAGEVSGSPWVGVVVVAEGTARRVDDDSDVEEEIGRAHIVTACFGGRWWDQLVLSPLGVHRSTDRPAGAIADAMFECVRKPPRSLDP